MEADRNLTIEELDELERSIYLPLTVVLVILMLIGIVGNILVLIVYKTKFTRSSARIYILSLAIADLSVCVVGIPYHVLDLTLILTYTHTNVCKVLSFLIGACTLSSIFILLVVGLDRYFKVCRPLKRQIRDFGDRKACILASFIAIVISIPHGIIYGESTVLTQVNNLTGVECFISDGYQGSELVVGYLGINVLVFVVSVIFLIIIYGLIYRKIYNDKMSEMITLKKTQTFGFCCAFQNRENEDDENEATGGEIVSCSNSRTKFQTSNSNKETCRYSCSMVRHVRPGSKAVEKNTKKITLMMLTITVVFIISYLPFIVISILDSTDETFWADRSVTELILLDFMLRIYLINNIANPIIYSFWDHRFRKETMFLLQTVCCFKQKEKRKRYFNSRGYSGALATTTYKGFSKCSEAATVKTNETVTNI